MKPFLSCLIIISTISCGKNTEEKLPVKKSESLVMKHLKDSILYEDQQKQIFLKHKVYFMSRRNREPENRFFNMAVFRDSIVELKDFIDIQSFKKQTKCDTFYDANYRYYFSHFPTKNPSIDIVKK